jgi:hypothetical protein
MVKYVSLIVIFFIACLTAVGCSNKSSDNPLVFEQSSHEFTAQLTIPQNPVPVMQETLLTLVLHDAEERPVHNASVRYDLTMPGMTMPPNHPQANEKENGVYETNAIFTMAGNWRCRAEVEASDSISLEFTFDFEAK